MKKNQIPTYSVLFQLDCEGTHKETVQHQGPYYRIEKTYEGSTAICFVLYKLKGSNITPQRSICKTPRIDDEAYRELFNNEYTIGRHLHPGTISTYL